MRVSILHAPRKMAIVTIGRNEPTERHLVAVAWFGEGWPLRTTVRYAGRAEYVRPFLLDLRERERIAKLYGQVLPHRIAEVVA